MDSYEVGTIENGGKILGKKEVGNSRTVHSTSMASASSSLRKRSDLALLSKVKPRALKLLLANLQEVLLGTKLAVFFLAIPLAIAAKFFRFGRVSWVWIILSIHSLF